MNCPTCSAPMKPLAFSMYCPNDCDRRPAAPTPAPLEVLLRKVPPGARDTALRWLSGPIMHSTVWYLCYERRADEVTIWHSLDKKAQQALYRAEWVLSINGKDEIRVFKNRGGTCSSIEDIPEWKPIR